MPSRPAARLLSPIPIGVAFARAGAGIMSLAIVALFASALLPPAPARAGSESFDAGTWFGNAFFDDDTHAFTHCAVSAPYESGESLVFALTSDGWLRVGLHNEAWRLEEGAAYEIAVAVDSTALGTFEADAFTESGVRWVLPYTDEVMALLAQGKVLAVRAARETLFFRLTGTGVALPRLERCFARAMAGGRALAGERPAPSANPFAALPAPADPFAQEHAAPGPAPPAPDAESVELMKVTLAEAGLESFHYLPPGERDGLFEAAEHAWTDGAVFGGLYVFGRGGRPLSLHVSDTTSAWEDACDGAFTYGVTSADFPDGTPARRAVATCETAQGMMYEFSFIFEDGAEVTIVEHTTFDRFRDLAAAADRKMYDFFTRVYGE